VGDAEFQKKCLGKMGDISKGEGRTVLFVSHNMAAVQNLCSKGILLENGNIYSNDIVENIVRDYLSSKTKNDTYIDDFSNYKNNSNYFSLDWFGLTDNKFEIIKTFTKNNSQSYITVKFTLKELVTNFNFGIAIYDLNENLLYWSFNTDSFKHIEPKLGFNDFKIELPVNQLNEGEYHIHFIASVHNEYWIHEPNVNSPYLKLKILGGLSKSKLWVSKRPGILAPILNYKTSS